MFGSAATRLILRFALLSALAVTAAGAAALWLVHDEEVSRAQDNVTLRTRYVAGAILAHTMRPSDFARPIGGTRRSELDALARRDILLDDVLRVKIYGPHATVVYSNDHTLIGTRPPEPDDVLAVLRGATLREVGDLNAEGGTGPNVKSLSVYVPIRLVGSRRVVGVLEFYERYAPVASAARTAMVRLAAILAGALLALWALLIPLLRRTSRALERSVDAHRRTEAALESTAEQLRQSQKLEAIGRLAGGIAHDFNNLLLAIGGYGELLVNGVADERLRGYAERVCSACERAAGMTQQLLAFSRRQKLEPHILDLNESVREVVKMFDRLLGPDVRMELDLDPALHPVEADPGQLTQVLLNLAVNARDAMSGSGTLTIATANDGDEVVLSVRDTGIGMDAETASHVFEPFFTTKRVGEGTGLGLATVYGIVTQTGGTIDIESEPGHGATFVVRLPRAERAEAALHVDTPSGGGSERILLVDDEDDVRAVVGQMLRAQGYHVIAAATPREAVAVDEPWDLLVTDVVMPEMNGVELARRLRADCVLFTSGYDGQSLVDERSPFLQKPFTTGELARRVRELLDAA